MGADAFVVCYGVRREVDASDITTVTLLEERRDPWQVAARAHGLQSWWGTTTDEGRCFLLVGKLLGCFGWEGKSDGQLDNEAAAAIITDTAARLRTAGIEGQPAWHFQFVPD